MIPAGEKNTLESELSSLEESGGQRILIVTKTANTKASRQSADEIRGVNTTIVLIDPTDGSILRARPSLSITSKLSESFWGEWAKRYENKFHVNDRGGPYLASCNKDVEKLHESRS